MRLRIGDVSLEVVQGDITTIEVDAVVNAANNHFWMGGGVAGAIKRVGGVDIETSAMSQGPIRVGGAVVTPAGDLPARWVIHAAVMGQDLVTSRDYIRMATVASLRKAGELAVASIAFPAFGTGVGGFSPLESAGAMIDGMIEVLRGECPRLLRRIVIVTFSADLCKAFADTLVRTSGRQRLSSAGQGDLD